MRVHARLQRLALILFKGVGGHRDNREIRFGRIGQCADAPRRFIAVHARHLHIHQHQFEVVGLRALDALHRFRAVTDRLHGEAGFFQNGLRDFAVQFVILHQQNAPVHGGCPLRLRRFFGRPHLAACREAQAHGER